MHMCVCIVPYVRCVLTHAHIHIDTCTYSCTQVCGNHRIESSYQLKTAMGSDRAWTWAAQDFADNELTNDVLAMKFKTTEGVCECV